MKRLFVSLLFVFSFLSFVCAASEFSMGFSVNSDEGSVVDETIVYATPDRVNKTELCLKYVVFACVVCIVLYFLIRRKGVSKKKVKVKKASSKRKEVVKKASAKRKKVVKKASAKRKKVVKKASAKRKK